MSALIVISGPGGVGKGTVVARMRELEPQLVLSRSWTTRDQRPGEADDAYTFVSKGEFEDAIAEGRFLEWDHHFGNYYGSPVPDADLESAVILEIDVNGALQIHDGGFDALFVFIDTPSVEIQRARMISRGDALDKVEERLVGGQRERDLAAELPYVHVLNDDVDRCAREILGLIVKFNDRLTVSDEES